MRDIDIGGGAIGILLIHGLGGTPVEMRYLADELGRAGQTVSVPLLAGHGGSAAALDATTWRDWYDTACCALERLVRRCDTVLVGGLSVGAVLALHLAHERPRQVHGAVLLSPTLWPNGWAIPWYFNLFRIIRIKALANQFRFSEVAPYGIKDERIRAMVLDALQANDPRPLRDILGRRGGTILEMRRMAETVLAEAPAIRQPALAVHPRHDDQADISNTMQLQQRLGGIVQALVLDDSYHMVTLDRQRRLVAERVVDFGIWTSSGPHLGPSQHDLGEYHVRQ